jgi:hypothetical protein
LRRYVGGAIFLLIGAAALFLSHDFVGAPYVSNDSVQYLDAAAHLATGDCFCTTVAHFDEQLAVGHMPIPFTHFAPGYPLLIAGLIRLGLTPETAGYLISSLSYLVTIGLFWYIGMALGASPWVLGALGLLWTTNSIAILTASSLTTESLYTAIVLGMAALMVADINTDGRRPPLIIAVGVLAGAAYWVRYPGLFVVPVAVLFLFWRYRRNRNTLPWVALGLTAAGIECLAIMLRNSLLIGSWRGGFSTGHGQSVKFIAVESVKAFYHIVFGDRVVAQLSIWAVVFVCSLACAIVLAALAWRRGRGKDLPPNFLALVAWVGLLVGVYVAGIIYAAMHSIASDLDRYYFPTYPLLLVILAAVTLAHKLSEKVVIVVLVISVLAVHSRSLLTRPVAPITAGLQRVFKEEVQPGVSLERWLRSHVSPSNVIVAVNGQAVHYVLKRPVVSVIEPEFSDRQTDETRFHALMSQYHARYILVFPGSNLVQERDIPFLRSLAAGSSPAWLTLATKTRDVTLYECSTCVE